MRKLFIILLVTSICTPAVAFQFCDPVGQPGAWFTTGYGTTGWIPFPATIRFEIRTADVNGGVSAVHIVEDVCVVPQGSYQYPTTGGDWGVPLLQAIAEHNDVLVAGEIQKVYRNVRSYWRMRVNSLPNTRVAVRAISTANLPLPAGMPPLLAAAAVWPAAPAQNFNAPSNNYDCVGCAPPPTPLGLVGIHTIAWPPDWNGILSDSNEGQFIAFSPPSHIVVEDFDSYADTTALTAVWTEKEGADIKLEKTPAYVRDGNSMEFAYRNGKTGGEYKGSEAVALASALGAGTDWTADGVEALVLYFQGDAGNAQEGQYIPGEYHITNDQMYVALEDGSAKVGIVKLPDMNDILEPSWQEWNIDLAEPCLADVNMANIAKVYIGFGGRKTDQSAGGAGTKSSKFDTVWFDDIGLYPPRCVPVVAWPHGDFDEDCVIDVHDLDEMLTYWLISNQKTDLTDDSIVNFLDYTVLADNWLQEFLWP